MTTADKLDGGSVVEFWFLVGAVGVVGEELFGEKKGFQGEVGVGHVGGRLAAITDAAVLGVVHFAVFVIVILAGDNEAAGLDGGFAVGLSLHHGESGEGEGGVVVGQGFNVDPTVLLLAGKQIAVGFFGFRGDDVRILPRIAAHGHDRKGGHGRVVRIPNGSGGRILA